MKKRIVLFVLALSVYNILSAQYVYTIKADSVKITNCDSSELIIENHSQAVPGFLYNTGNGRTIFKRPLTKVNDTLYLVGSDSLRIPNAWVQGGNAFGATGILGTKDNHHLDLYTNNTFRSRLTSTGNLLFGTATDNGSRLQVLGDATFTIPSTNKYVTVRSPGNNNWDKGTDFNYTDSDGVSNSFGLRVAAFNGSSGIRVVKLFQYNTTEAAFTGGTFTFDNIAFFAGGIMGGNNDDFIVRLLPNNGVSHPDPTGIKFSYGGLPLMSLMQTGAVGIGTATPSAQLHTTGSVRFAGLTNNNTPTRVLVSDSSGNLFYRTLNTWASNSMTPSDLARNWPDYVFASGYQLPSLSDLEQYIKQNHHLPEIAAATEVEKNGVNAGETQVILLKKIEEMTLYIIQQDKELNELKEQNKRLTLLQDQIDELKALIRK